MQQTKAKSGVTIGLLILAVGLVLARPVSGLGPRQEGYPPPDEVTIESPLIEEVPIQPTAFAYPPAGAGTDGATPIPIGSQAFEEGTDGNLGAGILDAQQGSGRGILFLWLGFFATSLIFLTSMVGAIVLFTRRNET